MQNMISLPQAFQSVHHQLCILDCKVKMELPAVALKSSARLSFQNVSDHNCSFTVEMCPAHTVINIANSLHSSFLSPVKSLTHM